MKASESLLVPGATRRQLMLGTETIAAVTLISPLSTAADGGISHSAESIHQEPVFKVTRKHLYDALYEAKQFDQVQRLSKAMQSKEVPDKAAVISREVGGAFSLFGGYITGRHIELLQGKRIVQAWRAQSWKQGDYSIVKFELVEQDSGTKTWVFLKAQQNTSPRAGKLTIGSRWRNS
jgi:activator of HSP90 ATPase